MISGTNTPVCISVTRSVFIIQGHGLSTLLWDKDCLHCSGTWSPKEDKVSTLLCHRECLLCYGICLHYYGIASSLVRQSDLSTLVCLVSSLVLAPVFFINLQECHYPVQRGGVLQNPCLRPRTRKISKSPRLKPRTWKFF